MIFDRYMIRDTSTGLFYQPDQKKKWGEWGGFGKSYPTRVGAKVALRYMEDHGLPVDHLEVVKVRQTEIATRTARKVLDLNLPTDYGYRSMG